jgi:uncharacterized protein (DUF362 family)
MTDQSNKPLVTVAKADSHYEGSRKALELIEDQIEKSIKDRSRVLIKPNFVSTRRQISASHVDAVRAVLDLLSEYYDGKITIGEGPAIGNFDDAISNYSFDSLIDEYGVGFKDLERDEFYELEGVNRALKPIRFRVSKTILESDYLVSVAKPKTHDCVIATLSIKNVVVGSLVTKLEKEKIHQGMRAINLNIAELAKHCMPSLGLIDGYEGMEGAGPTNGDPVRLGVASASLHPVSLDAVMAGIIGFDPLEIGYLHHLNEWGVGVANLDRIEVVGEPIYEVCKKFKPHPTYLDQLKWR